MSSLCKLDSDAVSFELFSDATAVLTDRATHQSWRMGPVAIQEARALDPGDNWQRTTRSVCEQFPARFRGSVEGDHLRFVVVDDLGAAHGSFTCRYTLDGPWLQVQILDLDEALPHLAFPTPLEADTLVLPQGVGQLRRGAGTYERFALRFFAQLNMRFFGGLRGPDANTAPGWIAIVHEGAPDAGISIASLCCTPSWLKSLGTWSGPRTVRYRLTTGGYVGIAKTFRAYAQQHGMFKSLADKAAAQPAIHDLLGARSVSIMQAETFVKSRWEDRCLPVPAHFAGRPEGVVPLVTFAQSQQLVAQCKAAGMKRGQFQFHGWIKGGYDETHPDIFPPEPALGTTAELQALCAEHTPYLSCLHDNYQDIYPHCPSFPHGVCRRHDGSPLRGGIWAGGQCYILNSAQSLEFARRNMPQLRALGPTAIYVDTVTAELFKESFEPGNTQTRTQDYQRKIQLLQLFADAGFIVASETGQDWGVPQTVWTPVGTHGRTAGSSVPLWPLVYHDAVMGFRGAWSPEDYGPQANLAARFLENVLYGQQLIFGGLSPATWPAIRPHFVASLPIDDLLRSVATVEMTGHRLSGADAQVEVAEYANGRAIFANFSAASQTLDGHTIPAHSHVAV
jgi:hypothetical protein